VAFVVQKLGFAAQYLLLSKLHPIPPGGFCPVEREIGSVQRSFKAFTGLPLRHAKATA
jgi:hypothetical protein